MAKSYDVMRTHRGYVVDAPDQGGDIEIEVEKADYIWLNKQDLLDMLKLFETSQAPTKQEKSDALQCRHTV